MRLHIDKLMADVDTVDDKIGGDGSINGIAAGQIALCRILDVREARSGARVSSEISSQINGRGRVLEARACIRDVGCPCKRHNQNGRTRGAREEADAVLIEQAVDRCLLKEGHTVRALDREMRKDVLV